MNCATCQHPIRSCPDRHRTGSCWYYLCRGFVHSASGLHADNAGLHEAHDGAALPLAEVPGGPPAGAVA